MSKDLDLEGLPLRLRRVLSGEYRLRFTGLQRTPDLSCPHCGSSETIRGPVGTYNYTYKKERIETVVVVEDVAMYRCSVCKDPRGLDLKFTGDIAGPAMQELVERVFSPVVPEVWVE